MSEPRQLDLFRHHVFECRIDESAGLKDEPERTQLTELPGDTWEEIFERPSDERD